MTRAGLNTTGYLGIDSIAVDEATDTAVAKVRVYQQEAQSEFVLDVLLQPEEDGAWRVVELTNLPDFVAFLSQARLAELAAYTTQSAAIMEKHDKSVREAEFDMMRLLAAGSLGNQDTRLDLKRLMEDRLLADWRERRDELAALTVPEAALTLHHLRLKICDLNIAYATGYAAWLTDKKAATIREADLKLKQARTLEEEARFLTRRISSQENKDV